MTLHLKEEHAKFRTALWMKNLYLINNVHKRGFSSSLVLLSIYPMFLEQEMRKSVCKETQPWHSINRGSLEIAFTVPWGGYDELKTIITKFISCPIYVNSSGRETGIFTINEISGLWVVNLGINHIDLHLMRTYRD